jgi:hypothetical protein
MNGESGESLAEVVVATTIVAVALTALFGGTLAATHRFGPDPVHVALERALQNEMRLAVDLTKYQGGSIAPGTVATTIPMPSGSPIPVHLSIATAPLPIGGIAVTLTATSDDDAEESATIQGAIPAPVPLPGSSVAAPAAMAAPN